MPGKSVVVLVGLAAMPLCAPAQVETVRTQLESQAAPRQGFQYRADVSKASEVSARGDVAAARRLLRPALEYCDQLQRPGRDAVSFANATEYEAYVDASGKGTPVEWIDMACPSAYKMSAFLDIEEKDAEGALAFLDKAIAASPYWVEPHTERGYLLNQLGRTREGLASYEHALELVERFPSNQYAKAMVLRGLGYTHIELGNLDRAEAMYRQSLEVEPGNPLAQRELDYIAKQRAGTK